MTVALIICAIISTTTFIVAPKTLRIIAFYAINMTLITASLLIRFMQ